MQIKSVIHEKFHNLEIHVCNDEMNDEVKDVISEDTPLGRLGRPEEVAETLYYLSSEKASFITGQIIGVNGGYLI